MATGVAMSVPGSEHPRSAWLILPCLMAAVAIVGSVAAIFVPSFLTNDDPVMLLIASGRLVSEAPDEHVLYTNVVVGAGLRWLYQHLPQWPWYSLYLYAALCVAAALTLASCLRWRPARPIRYLTWIAVLWILVRFTMTLHFTVVATWLSWASLVWCASVCRGPSSSAGVWRAAAVAAGGLALAGLIRPEAAALGVSLAAPVLVWVLVSAGRHRLLPAVSGLIAGALIVSGATAANRAYYAASPGWEQFYEINTAKGFFLDSDLIQDGPYTGQALRSVGWERADLGMIRRWYFLDEEIFSLERMRTFARSTSRRAVPERVWRGVGRLGSVRRDPLAEFAVGLVVILILIAPWWVSGWTVVVGGWWVLLALAVAVAARPMPESVYLPCLAAVVCSGLLFASSARVEVISRRAVVVGILLLLGPGIVQARSLLERSTQQASRLVEFRDDWLALTSERRRLIVAWADGFPFELVVSPLRESADIESAPFAVIGTLSRSPFTSFRLREAAVRDLHIDMIDDPGIVLVAKEENLPILIRFLRSRHQRTVEARPAFSGRTLTAWHLVEHPTER